MTLTCRMTLRPTFGGSLGTGRIHGVCHIMEGAPPITLMWAVAEQHAPHAPPLPACGERSPAVA